jgi:hypothetical protein
MESNLLCITCGFYPSFQGLGNPRGVGQMLANAQVATLGKTRTSSVLFSLKRNFQKQVDWAFVARRKVPTPAVKLAYIQRLLFSAA